MLALILIRGGGDLASGVAYRLHRVGLKVAITELPQPLAVRRLVSFSEAVYEGQITVEGITARLAHEPADIPSILAHDEIPVLVDPKARIFHSELITRFSFLVLIDACMIKRPPEDPDYINAAPLVIGLGPGFVASENCHAVIETNRGHFIGRVYWQGAPEPDTGIPEPIARMQAERVLRAPADGILHTHVKIGDILKAGQPIAEVSGQTVTAPFHGVLRGLLRPGLTVTRGLKIGDLDPRNHPRLCRLISDKSLAVGGGVLEAILSRADLRNRLWE